MSHPKVFPTKYQFPKGLPPRESRFPAKTIEDRERKLETLLWFLCLCGSLETRTPHFREGTSLTSTLAQAVGAHPMVVVGDPVFPLASPPQPGAYRGQLTHPSTRFPRWQVAARQKHRVREGTSPFRSAVCPHSAHLNRAAAGGPPRSASPPPQLWEIQNIFSGTETRVNPCSAETHLGGKGRWGAPDCRLESCVLINS